MCFQTRSLALSFFPLWLFIICPTRVLKIYPVEYKARRKGALVEDPKIQRARKVSSPLISSRDDELWSTLKSGERQKKSLPSRASVRRPVPATVATPHVFVLQIYGLVRVNLRDSQVDYFLSLSRSLLTYLSNKCPLNFSFKIIPRINANIIIICKLSHFSFARMRKTANGFYFYWKRSRDSFMGILKFYKLMWPSDLFKKAMRENNQKTKKMPVNLKLNTPCP